jgi:crotonobetainyl-CoA:carnitine CoA-transferase CaiB-like acyl-CoA transferase
MPAPAPRLSATPGQVRAPGPKLGAHTDEVMREWLD